MSDNRMILVASYFDVGDLKYPTQWRVGVVNSDAVDEDLGLILANVGDAIYRKKDADLIAETLQETDPVEYGIVYKDYGNQPVRRIMSALEGIDEGEK